MTKDIMRKCMNDFKKKVVKHEKKEIVDKVRSIHEDKTLMRDVQKEFKKKGY